jgi:hypothetical protein
VITHRVGEAPDGEGAVLRTVLMGTSVQASDQHWKAALFDQLQTKKASDSVSLPARGSERDPQIPKCRKKHSPSSDSGNQVLA